MLELEMLARAEQKYRDEVVFPRANRLGRAEREQELEDLRNGRIRRGRGPVSWLGRRLVGAGARLVALGERLSPPQHGGLDNPPI